MQLEGMLGQWLTLQRGQLFLRADQRDRHARQKTCMHGLTTALSHRPRMSPKPVTQHSIKLPRSSLLTLAENPAAPWFPKKSKSLLS